MWSILAAQRVVLRQPLARLSRYSYHSRAHPRPIPESAVSQALESVLQDIQQRRNRRERKFQRNGLKDRPHPDETVELALNLNLDPRKPGQAIRGSISLPHGTGKTLDCIVFTSDDTLAEAALKAGATHVGGTDLVEQITGGQIAVDGLQRALATNDIMPVLSRQLARILGPRGLMPNAKVGTLFTSGPELLEALEQQIAGKEVTFRTEKEGIVQVPVGKGSFGMEKLLENIGQVMKTVFQVKPENYGKGKKSKSTGKGAKYLLRASVCSTQGKGMRLDLRTLDPSSAFFLTAAEGNEGQQQDSSAANS